MSIPAPRRGGEPIHPGESLKDDLDALGLTMSAAADKLGVPKNRITHIVNGQRGITADTALRLSAFLGTSAEFWLALQANYDLRKAELESGEAIKVAVKRYPNAA